MRRTILVYGFLVLVSRQRLIFISVSRLIPIYGFTISALDLCLRLKP